MCRFALNTAQNRLAAGLRPDPLRELITLPRPPSWIKGEGREGEGTGREWRRRKGQESEGKEGHAWEGKGGKGGRYLPPIRLSGYAHEPRKFRVLFILKTMGYAEHFPASPSTG